MVTDVKEATFSKKYTVYMNLNSVAMYDVQFEVTKQTALALKKGELYTFEETISSANKIFGLTVTLENAKIIN